MRPWRALAVSVVAASMALGLAQACGLDVVGTLGQGEADGAARDGVPAPCTTLDASCVGALPSGWSPVTISDAGCPPAFQAAALETAPRVESGGCVCEACRITGLPACTGGVPISGGNGCGDNPFETATPFVCKNGNSTQHVMGHPPRPTGAASCVSEAGAGVATTDPITVCVPSCNADLCATGARCAMADGELDCPSGFTLAARVGTGAVASCAPCGCEAGVAPGTCEGQITVFSQGNCNDAGGPMQTYPLTACNDFQPGYTSVFVEAHPPDASCTPASPVPSTGDASLVGTKTICCR